MRLKKQKGQALLLVVLAAGLFLIGAMGLVVDGAQIYAQRQMAQAAADAGAQAGIMSIMAGTNTSGAAQFGTGGAFTCTTSDAETPCVYARNNGFGGSASDTVVVDFPTAAQVGVSAANLSGSDPVNIIRVTVNRTLTTGLMHLLGAATAPVKAIGVAAIVELVSPVPILVLHPTASGSFHMNGNDKLVICGGPARSIQINSFSATSIDLAGASSLVNLSKAGPKDDGSCNTGTGADFGAQGGPKPYPGGVCTTGCTGLELGTTGHDTQPATWMKDPLLSVTQPVSAGLPAGTSAVVPSGTNGCPVASCTLYQPGIWDHIQVKNDFALFAPGLYYVNGNQGFSMDSNSNAIMATGIAGAGDFANGGMMVFLTGNASISITANAGKNPPGISLLGSDPAGTYKNILFFEDRTAAANTHELSGGGSLTLIGTVYLTNTRATMLTTAAHFQKLSFSGGPGSSTHITGEIIVDELSLSGGGGGDNITMNLNPAAAVKLRQVALVH